MGSNVLHLHLHLADAKATYRLIQAIHFCQYVCSWELKPQPVVLLTQCSTTEPQELCLDLTEGIKLYSFGMTQDKIKIDAVAGLGVYYLLCS